MYVNAKGFAVPDENDYRRMSKEFWQNQGKTLQEVEALARQCRTAGQFEGVWQDCWRWFKWQSDVDRARGIVESYAWGYRLERRLVAYRKCSFQPVPEWKWELVERRKEQRKLMEVV